MRCRVGRLILPVLTQLITIIGCERRPLLDASNLVEVRVEIDTEGLHNVTCDIYNPEIPIPDINPEMLRVLFYEPGQSRIAGESYISNISTNASGNRVLSGRVGILPGEYEMVIYNFDLRSTLVRNDFSHRTIEAYTESVSSVLASRFESRAGENTQIHYQPDLTFVATNPHEFIPWHDDIHTIDITASSIVETFYLQVRVEGLEYVSSAQAIVTGMAGSNFIGSRNRVDVPETATYLTLTKSKDGEAAVLCNIFHTFGRIDTDNELWITFDINTVDGRTETREFEISDLFESDVGRNHHWLLLDEVITIDKPLTPPTAGGGFAPEMEDWEGEEHEIIM